MPELSRLVVSVIVSQPVFWITRVSVGRAQSEIVPKSIEAGENVNLSAVFVIVPEIGIVKPPD